MKKLLSTIAILFVVEMSFAQATTEGKGKVTPNAPTPCVPTKPLQKVTPVVIPAGYKIDTSTVVILLNNKQYEYGAFRVRKSYRTSGGATISNGELYFTAKWVAIKQEDIFGFSMRQF